MHYRVDNPDGSFMVIDSGLPLSGAVEITNTDVSLVADLGVNCFERSDEEGVVLKPALELNEVIEREQQAKKESDPAEKLKAIEDRLSNLDSKQTNEQAS